MRQQGNTLTRLPACLPFRYPFSPSLFHFVNVDIRVLTRDLMNEV